MSSANRWFVCFALIAVAALSAPAVAQDNAGDEGRFRFAPVGSFFSRYELRENYADQTDIVRYRARLGVQSDAFDIGNDLELSLRFVPQSSGLWHVGGDTVNDAGLDLHEGFIELDFARSSSLQAGRFEMSYGDELVIGTVGWHHTGRSFDGVRWRLRPNNGFGLDLFGTLLTEGAVRTDPGPADEIGGGDVWFLGAYSMLGYLLGDGQALDVYVLGRLAPRDTLDVAPADDLPTTLEVTAGVRVKGSYSDLDWRAEGGLQGGRHAEARTVAALAYSVDGEVGYTVGDATNFRLGLNGFLASGDDPDTEKNEGYFQLYPTAHKWMGFMDYVGARSNVAGGALLLSAQFGPRWKAYTNIYEFHRLEDGAREPGVPDAPVQEAGRLGTEVDAGFRFAIGRGTGFRVGYGLFVPVEEVSDELFHFAEFELRADLP